MEQEKKPRGIKRRKNAVTKRERSTAKNGKSAEPWCGHLLRRRRKPLYPRRIHVSRGKEKKTGNLRGSAKGARARSEMNPSGGPWEGTLTGRKLSGNRLGPQILSHRPCKSSATGPPDARQRTGARNAGSRNGGTEKKRGREAKTESGSRKAEPKNRDSSSLRAAKGQEGGLHQVGTPERQQEYQMYKYRDPSGHKTSITHEKPPESGRKKSALGRKRLPTVFEKFTTGNHRSVQSTQGVKGGGPQKELGEKKKR